MRRSGILKYMIKWAEIAGECSRHQFTTLSEFLTEQGLSNTVEFIDCSVVDFPETLQKALSQYKALRIGSPFRETAFQSFKHYSEALLRIRSADSIVHQTGKWWLRTATPYGIEEVLKRAGDNLDIESAALVVGAGGGARMAAAALIKSGFKKINVTNKFFEQANEMITDLRRSFFDVEFEFIAQDRLVLLPGMHSIVINATPLSPANDLLSELYYFNFLQTSGMVIDLTVFPYDTPLIMEASAIGVKVIRGYEVAAHADAYWTDLVFGRTIDVDTYLEKLKTKVQSVPFDLEPYRSSFTEAKN